MRKLQHSSTRAKVTALVALFGLVVLGGAVSIGSASAAPKPPTPPQPTIASGPSGAVASMTAAFTYTDARAGVAFQCKLDSGNYSSCPTLGKQYDSLSDGSHTFSVTAKNASSDPSPPATRSWTVDTRAPAVTLTFPASGGPFNAVAWNAGCSAPGICGSASDPNGVALVRASILQVSTGRFWNGSAFVAFGPVLVNTIGTTTWRLPVPVPSGGLYLLVVVATDNLGNTSRGEQVVGRLFQVDTTAPPVPVITKAPPSSTTATTASTGFTDSEANVRFECSLDGGAFVACRSGVSFTDLAPSSHCLRVRALDAAGNASAPASTCWTIVIVGNFTISGNTPNPFAPGVTQSVNLSIANTFAFTIQVTSVTITIDPATSKPACAGSTNLVVSQSLSVPVNVPASTTKTLQDLGVPTASWPKFTMPNLSTNQDACKGASFTIHYTGQATTP